MEFGLVALWIGTFLLLGLVALPIAAWLFDEGYAAGLAIPLALVVIAVVGHLVGHLAFGWPALLAGLVVLVAGSYVASTHVDVDRRGFAEAAVVFVLGFLLVVLIRGYDPSAGPLPVAIGEKFLDFGMLKTIARADTLPPEDFWFANEPVRYYYGGHLLTVLLATLTGTAPRFAYNLALAGFFGTLVTAAYGLAGSIARPYAVSRRLAGGLAAFFVGIAANLHTAANVLVWGLPDPAAGLVVWLFALPESVREWQPEDFFYFDASRGIPTNASLPDSPMAATEFPLFAWLNGDLHAHMMSQPFMLLAGAILLAYWRVPTESRRRRALVLFGLLPPVAGFVGFTNLWSFPTVGGLTMLAVALAPADPATLLPAEYADRLPGGEGLFVPELRRAVLGLVAAAGVLLLGVVWTLPFWTGVILGGPGREAALWNARTPLGPLLVVHGAFLAVFFVALARRTGAELDDPLRVLGAFAVAIALGTLVGFPALGLVVPLGVAAWWLVRTRDADFELVLLVAGAGLVLIVELFTVGGERFNAIFKPYAHVWLFWAVAAGVLLARLADGWPAEPLAVDRARLRLTGRVLAALLVVSTGLYAGFALPAHVDNSSPTVEAEGTTLDATAYLEVRFPTDAPAIRWLDDREGQPTIVTQAPGGYRWRPTAGQGSSAPASLTGLPTVLGWFHEAQYRGDAPYQRRLGHVNAIYTSTDREYQRNLLDFYEVEYVYVGPAERTAYDRITVGQLENVSVAKQWRGVTIYRVE